MAEHKIGPGAEIELRGEPRTKIDPGVQVKIRLRARLFDRLRDEAREQGVVFSTSLVDRLERSIDHQDLLPDLLALAYGPEAAEKLMEIGRTMRDALAARSLASSGHVGKSLVKGVAEQCARALHALADSISEDGGEHAR